jgi:hypothetical protein
MKKLKLFPGILLAVLLSFTACEDDDKDSSGGGSDGNGNGDSEITFYITDFAEIGAFITMRELRSSEFDSFSTDMTGKDQVWKFNADYQNYYATDSIKFLSPAGLTSQLAQNADILMFDTGDSLFIKKGTDKLEFIGVSMSGVAIEYSDPMTMAQFPMSYGSSFTDEAYASKIDSMQGSLVKMEFKNRIEQQIDGSGKLIMNSDTFNCLREYRVQYDEMNMLSDMDDDGTFETKTYSDLDTTYAYSYISKEIGYPVLEIDIDKNGKIIDVAAYTK